MRPTVVLLTLALVFVGLGFAAHPLWGIAIALLVIWAIGFVFREA